MEAINKSLENICAGFTEEEALFVDDAFKYVEQAMEGMKRGNNHAFIEHPLGAAEIIVSELGLDATAVAAYFIHEATRFKPELLEQLRKEYSDEIISIAVGLNEIAKIRPKDTQLEAENYRRLIISYSTDPRVTLIKLADRLEVMRNLTLRPKSSRERKTTETILLYAPLAHQLGLYRLKSELENLYFRYSDPVNYRILSNKVKATEADRQKLVKDFIIPLKEKLDAEGIHYQLKARTKTTYSIWKKMQVQSVPFEQVFDVFAIRFIIDAPADPEIEKSLCWKVYSLVTEEYEADMSRYRDWITNPKRNGYESLHATVKSKDDRLKMPLEVQIRTKRMDDVAENGMAAHWLYKGIKRAKAMDDWLANVKKMLENPDPEVYTNVIVESIKDIFVYTPTGDLKRLPNNATVLDFAFSIHTNVGIRCTGAKVNGRILSIKEKLKTGDVVEILTSRNQKPAPDWLQYVVTPKAKAKIRQKLQEEKGKIAAAGREMLERRLKNWKLEVDDEILADMVKFFKVKSLNDFFAAISEEEIEMADVKEYISSHQEENENRSAAPEEEVKNETKTDNAGSGGFLVIGNLDDISYKMAKCCNPIYGDDVFAFVSATGGVKIHRMSCPNAARLIQDYPYRIQQVKWKSLENTSSFQVEIKVLVEEELTQGQFVFEEAVKNGVSVREFSVKDKNAGRLKIGNEVYLKLFVSSNSHLDRLISALKKKPEVQSVTRIK